MAAAAVAVAAPGLGRHGRIAVQAGRGQAIEVVRPQCLRVAANLLDRELFGALERAGHPADTVEVVRLPSECCGSCSG